MRGTGGMAHRAAPGAQRERTQQQDESPAQRQKESERGPRSLSRKTSEAAAPAVPQATPAKTR